MVWLTQRFRWVLLAAAVLVLGLAVGCVLVDSSRCRWRLEADYRIANEALVLTFSRAARTALIRGEKEFLESAARMIVAGGAVSVQIVLGDEVVLLETSGDPPTDCPALAGIAELEPSAAYDRFEGYRLLDVVRPFLSSNPNPSPVGYVRVLFDPAIVTGQLRMRILAGAGIAAGSAGALLGALWLVLARIRRRALPSEGDWRTCGGVAISRSRKLVRVFDEEMTLTPKQFELLAHLASEPGRVFPDVELIEAVWSTSAYANSSDVKQCIYTLRKRLGEAVIDPHALIETVTGHGYRINPPGPDQRLNPI